MIRVGVGGWTYAPWRNNFYPAGLPHAQELRYASEHLSTIEINGTFYRTQSPTSFRKWRDETPEGFVFSVKGHRNVVNRTKLAEGKEAIDWFIASGILELGDKLGPILWQLAAHKRYDRDDMAGFLSFLPHEVDGQRVLHAIEPRHESFQNDGFVALAREADVAIVKADSDKYPTIDDLSGPFVYARLQRSAADIPTGYAPADLDLWAGRCRGWAAGRPIAGAPLLAPATQPGERPVFVYMISGAKERAPAAAMALIDRLGRS